MHATLERRDKWDVDDRFALPNLTDIVDGEVHHDFVDTTNTYYDTPDHDLQAHGVRLRHLDSGGETGWQLRIPAADGPTELRWIDSDTPPDEVTTLLAGLTLGKAIGGVATIHTRRERYRVDGPERRCIEVDDDRVRASVGERLLAWRELEVDASSGARPVAKRLTKRLRAAGARPSRHSSKLTHALPERPARATSSPGARALLGYLDAQIDQIVAGDIGLRRGQDPIHDTRVAIRRLRSTLRVFGKALDASAVGDLDDELKWFSALLGDVRDCQVQQRRFSDALDEMSENLVLGPVRTRIRSDLQAIELPARTRLSEAMDSERYLAIMALLRRWRSAPPVKPGPVMDTLRKRAQRAQRKADRRLAAGLRADDDVLLHKARKAAKRARYAAELRKPLEPDAKRTVKQYKRIQSLLGDHQDTVVATEALRRMAVAAGTTADENGFTYGLLYAREQQIARQSRSDARRLL